MLFLNTFHSPCKIHKRHQNLLLLRLDPNARFFRLLLVRALLLLGRHTRLDLSFSWLVQTVFAHSSTVPVFAEGIYELWTLFGLDDLQVCTCEQDAVVATYQKSNLLALVLSDSIFFCFS